MKAAWTIARRELKALFDSPAGYVLLVVFLVINAFLFFRQTGWMSCTKRISAIAASSTVTGNLISLPAAETMTSVAPLLLGLM